MLGNKGCFPSLTAKTLGIVLICHVRICEKEDKSWAYLNLSFLFLQLFLSIHIPVCYC